MILRIVIAKAKRLPLPAGDGRDGRQYKYNNFYKNKLNYLYKIKKYKRLAWLIIVSGIGWIFIN